MKLSEELKWRGFWNQTTFSNPEILDNQPLTIYLGADPSADSLHIGHLSVYMMVRQFLDHGHNVVLLVGGGTGMIGDMRDTEERNLLSVDEVAKNTSSIKHQVQKLFSGKDFKVVNNYDWLSGLELLPFLRDIGKKFNMTDLTSRDFFKARIGNGNGLSYAEFSYTILQGYDFLHLYKNFGVNLQIGGSDQWGNLISGVELIRKSEGAEVFAMTAPLVINKSTGRKFGKSEGGAVWLDENKTSVYKFYQFWLNCDDIGAIDYLKLFTTIPKEEIEKIEHEHSAAPHLRIAQKTLAREVTSLVHGADRVSSIEKVNSVLFGGVLASELSMEELEILAEEIPSVKVGTDVNSALIESGLAKSSGEVKRLISAGAISLNGEKITKNLEVSQISLIKKGKNNFVLIKQKSSKK